VKNKEKVKNRGGKVLLRHSLPSKNYREKKKIGGSFDLQPYQNSPPYFSLGASCAHQV